MLIQPGRVQRGRCPSLVPEPDMRHSVPERTVLDNTVSDIVTNLGSSTMTTSVLEDHVPLAVSALATALPIVLLVCAGGSDVGLQAPQGAISSGDTRSPA